MKQHRLKRFYPVSSKEEKPLYYVMELSYSTRVKQVGSNEDLDRAKEIAWHHSYRTGKSVEIQDKLGKVIDRYHVWRE